MLARKLRELQKVTIGINPDLLQAIENNGLSRKVTKSYKKLHPGFGPKSLALKADSAKVTKSA